MKILKEFLEYLKLKKLSEKSVKNYISDVRQFLKWTAKKSFINFTPNVFAAYKVYLLNQKTPTKTINRYLSSLRTFGQFLKQEKLMMLNPTQGLENINIRTSLVPSGIRPGLVQAKRPVLKEFEQDLIKQRLKPATIKNYISDVSQFLEFLNHFTNPGVGKD